MTSSMPKNTVSPCFPRMTKCKTKCYLQYAIRRYKRVGGIDDDKMMHES